VGRSSRSRGAREGSSRPRSAELAQLPVEQTQAC
jgi:hypothetical protein